MMEDLLKDKKFMKLVNIAELLSELLIKESESSSLLRVYKQCDYIRDAVNKFNEKFDGEKALFYNRIYERSLEKSMKILEVDGFHQSEIYFIQDLLSHIRSFK